jgi:hypothetical protein
VLAWRKGTKGALKAGFTAVRVRVADGQPQRIGDKDMQHMPGDQVWLGGERRASGEQKCYLAKPTSRRWPRRSRRAGSASRLTSSSGKNSAPTTSKAAHGEVIALR